MRLVARAYACVFELLVSLVALGLAWLAWVDGLHLRLPMFYEEGASLNWWLLGVGVVGVVVALLAITGAARWPLVLWALAVFVQLFRGYFLSSYHFAGRAGFWQAVSFTGGALLAFVGSVAPRRKHGPW
jgi:hypothetical protein